MIREKAGAVRTILPVCLWLMLASVSVWSQTTGPDKDLGSFFAAIEAGDLEGVRLAINAGVDINARTREGLTALMLAARSGWPRIVRELIERGAMVNARIAHYGITALTLARRNQAASPEVVDLLLAAGAVEGAADERGEQSLTLSELP